MGTSRDSSHLNTGWKAGHFWNGGGVWLWVLLFLGAVADSWSVPVEPLSVAGKWCLRLDPGKAGEAERWYEQTFAEEIQLPGSTDEAGYGSKVDFGLKSRPETKPRQVYRSWSRKFRYVGPVWYQRDIELPEPWRGKRVVLVLERCQWESQVWFGGRPVGMQDSLTTPHVHVLTAAADPGRHRLVIRVDNTLKHDLGDSANMISEQTQPNFNGIIGRMEVRATDPVWIEDVQVTPVPGRHLARVKVSFCNSSSQAANGKVELSAVGPADGSSVSPQIFEVRLGSGSTKQEFRLPMGRSLKLWDEYSPGLYDLSVQLSASIEGRMVQDERRLQFGIRQFGVTTNKQFTLNGKTIYLRGTVENDVWPVKGYPSMDVESWLQLFRVCRSYGLNHLRFHSWCPPESAFTAADRMGFYLQPEAPVWIHDWGRRPERDQWVNEEVLRILREYGNHPSFCMLSMGNEPAGDLSIPDQMTKRARESDPRRLYLRGSAWGPAPYDDYDQRGGPVPWQKVDGMRGYGGPGTDWDFASVISLSRLPLVTHELGQYAVYPRMEEIDKYSGTLRAWNFEMIREDLRSRHLLDQASGFFLASGKLAALLYKADVEAARRTHGHAGFQMLSLTDFPGQGTALVGLLDSFWDSKGLLTPGEFREFSGPTAVLARLPGRTFTTAERIPVRVQISHFGPEQLKQVVPVWTFQQENGVVIGHGQLPARTVAPGGLAELGSFSIPLTAIEGPVQCKLVIALEGRGIQNSWNIWVYPGNANVAAPANVLLASEWTPRVAGALSSGGRVVLFGKPDGWRNSLPGNFSTVFWSPVMFGSHKATMGLLCDPVHPALRQFPTASHSDWQWSGIVEHSQSVVLDDWPAGFRPIVQVIDNFVNNRRLGMIFETRVGEGRLLVCAVDLNRPQPAPEAKQLRASLLAYAGSDRFQPSCEVTLPTVAALFPDPLLKALAPKIHSDTANSDPYGANAAMDGDPDSYWHTAWEGAAPGFPHELIVELTRPAKIWGIKCLPRQDGSERGWIKDYAVFASIDGQRWGEPVAEGAFLKDAEWKTVKFSKPVEGRFLKLLVKSSFRSKQPYASLAELQIIFGD